MNLFPSLLPSVCRHAYLHKGRNIRCFIPRLPARVSLRLRWGENKSVKAKQECNDNNLKWDYHTVVMISVMFGLMIPNNVKL